MHDADWPHNPGVATYVHWLTDERPVRLSDSVTCFQHPETGARYVTRALVTEDFLTLYDDGKGEDMIACPFDYHGEADRPDPLRIFRLAEGHVTGVPPGVLSTETLNRLNRLNQPSPFARGGVLPAGRVQSPPDQRGWMMGANLCLTCGKAYGDHQPPVMYPDLVCHDPRPPEPEPEGGWFADAIRSAQVAHDPPPGDLADTMRKAVSDALTAQYEPQGLILHPVDHAHVGIDPDDPKSIEAAKRVADAFGVPFWLVGIPGYRPPLRVRVRGFLRRLPRRLLTTLPLVEHWGPRETGEGWMNDAEPEPWAGRWFVHLGNYRIGHEVEREPFYHGDDEDPCPEDHA